jgi:hypothetical protein
VSKYYLADAKISTSYDRYISGDPANSPMERTGVVLFGTVISAMISKWIHSVSQID